MRITCYFCKCATPCWSKEQQKDPLWLTDVRTVKTFSEIRETLVIGGIAETLADGLVGVFGDIHNPSPLQRKSQINHTP